MGSNHAWSAIENKAAHIPKVNRTMINQNIFPVINFGCFELKSLITCSQKNVFS